MFQNLYYIMVINTFKNVLIFLLVMVQYHGLLYEKYNYYPTNITIITSVGWYTYNWYTAVNKIQALYYNDVFSLSLSLSL